MTQEETLERYTLIITSMASFLSPFMSSAINLAIPSIGATFKSNAFLLTWVVSCYILISAAVVLPCGRLGDIYGRKKIFFLGVAIFSISSLLCSKAWSSESLIVFRILQGLGSAMSYSTATAILTSVYPPHSRGKALGIITTATFIGFSLGPFLGGAMTHNLGWKSIFYFSFLVGTVILLLIVMKLKGEWAEANGGKFDKYGTVLYIMGMITFICGFSSIATSPWSKYSLMVGLGVIALFIRQELRTDQPIINIRFFSRNVAFVFSNLSALIYFITTSSVTFLLSLHLQVVAGYNSQTAGLILLAQPLVMAVLSPFSGSLSDRIEPRVVASCGMGLATLGLTIFCFVHIAIPTWQLVGTLIILGTGAAFFSSPNTNSIMGSVPNQFYGVASATLGTMRNVGQALSMATVTLITNLYIGNTPLGPANAYLLEKGVKLTFIVFTAICFFGIFISLARGSINTRKEPLFQSQEHSIS